MFPDKILLGIEVFRTCRECNNMGTSFPTDFPRAYHIGSDGNSMVKTGFEVTKELILVAHHRVASVYVYVMIIISIAMIWKQGRHLGRSRCAVAPLTLKYTQLAC